MEIIKELEDTCCIFYLTLYYLGLISLATNWGLQHHVGKF
jgi:hypothetical protein